jgi:hypothetical protein
MHFICRGEKILLDEPVVCRRDSLPLLRSCKVRFVGLDSSQHTACTSIGNMAEWVRLSRASSNYSTMLHADCLQQMKSDGYGQPLPTTRHDCMSRALGFPSIPIRSYIFK